MPQIRSRQLHVSARESNASDVNLLPARGGFITICHPAYAPSLNILIRLIGADSSTGQFRTSIAHSAAAIIANNRHDGWLSQDKRPDSAAAITDELLAPGSYYFHLPFPQSPTHPTNLPEAQSLAYNYPIVPTFGDWLYPHHLPLPEPWHNTTIPTTSDAATTGEIKCWVTRRTHATEQVHIIPAKEKTWFLRNQMSRYGQSTSADKCQSGPANNIRLRRDIHWLLDTDQVVLLPGPYVEPHNTEEEGGTSHTSEMVLAAWVDEEEIRLDYHLKPLRAPIPSRLSIEYCYARFAYCVIAQVRDFLSAQCARYLVRVNEKGVLEQKWVSGEDCSHLTTRARSASPKKRNRVDTVPGPEDQGEWIDAGETVDADSDNVSSEGGTEVAPRGVKRRRMDDQCFDSGYYGDEDDPYEVEADFRGRTRVRT